MYLSDLGVVDFVHSWVAFTEAEPKQLLVFTQKEQWIGISDNIIKGTHTVYFSSSLYIIN